MKALKSHLVVTLSHGTSPASAKENTGTTNIENIIRETAR
jgi:hypothetical protein